MATYRNTVICKDGQELLAKAVAGLATIHFTSIKTSATQYTESQLENLTDIGTVIQSVGISASTAESTNVVSLYGAFTNASLQSGYYCRNFGIFAEDPEDSSQEILYAIVNADESTVPATYIPAYGGKGTSGVNFSCEIIVANASEVEVTLDPSAGVPLNLFNDTVATINATITTHTGSSIYSEAGVHGLRYYEEALQAYNETTEEWEDISSGGGGIAPNDVPSFKVKKGNGQLTIFWEDPEDTVVEGQTLCTWAGTKLIMKQGAFPDSVKDGTQIVDNRVRDQYKTTGFTITGLTNDTTYYFQLFPYSDQKVYNNRAANQFTGTPKAFVTLGIEINLSDSNPATWATYTDDAVGMTAGSSAFDDFDIYGNIQSYTFKDGAEVKALSKTDVTKYADGTSAATDIASGTYDVMTKFTRGGYYINHSSGKLIIKVTDDPEAEGFCYKAFQRGANELDEFYLGRYKGYIDGSGKLRSYSGVTPTGNKTIGAFRTAAQLNGAGYENSGFYQLVWRQCLYLVKYLAKNSQDTIGKGYTGGSAVTATGSTNGHGDTYGTQTATDHMILFGLEDFWGNIWEWIDGLATDASYNILTNTDNFQDDGKGTGYQSTASGASSNDGGYMTDVQGTNDTGLVYKTKNGSATTYFCDYGGLSSSCVAKFGGDYGNGDLAGVCYLYVSTAASYAGASVGGRVMFLKKQAS